MLPPFPIEYKLKMNPEWGVSRLCVWLAKLPGFGGATEDSTSYSKPCGMGHSERSTTVLANMAVRPRKNSKMAAMLVPIETFRIFNYPVSKILPTTDY